MGHQYNQIILFGDSITQYSHNPSQKGWGAAIQDSYSRKLDVLNRGFGGYNSEQAKYLLPHLLPRKNDSIRNPKILLLIIFFGANDAAIPPSLQHVSLEKYKENLRQIIDIVKNPNSPHHSPETRILLINPPPIHEESWKKCQEDKGEPMNRTSEITAKYAQTCVDLANELKIPVVNLWKLITDKTKNDHVTLMDFLTDGLHLSALGNETLFYGVMDTIRENMPELKPDNLKQLTPLRIELSTINPEQQFDSLESNIINQLDDLK